MLQRGRPQEKERSVGIFDRLLRKVDGCDVRIIFDGKMEENMVSVEDMHDRKSERLHLFASTEPVCGRVVLLPKGGYRHNGILVELVGVITFRDKGEKLDFMRQDKNFEADTIRESVPLEFYFSAPKEYESYRGHNVSVSYYLRLTIYRPVKNIYAVEELWITKVDKKLSDSQPDASRHSSYFRETVFGPQSISMEVGVDNVLHIEFKYDKGIFHLWERVLGKITFKIADLNIKHGEVSLLRKEVVMDKHEKVVHCETLQTFEIMDGMPIVGEVVPIRLYLGSIPNLTPTYVNVHNYFRVLYYLNLVFVTCEERRYYKQQEIIIYRRSGQELHTGAMTEQH